MKRDDDAGSGRDESNPSAADSFVRISELRTSIAEALSRIDEIRQQEIPQIKADYATRIGVWNARLLKAELAARRAKRQHAMARASVNRGERADAASITKQLDAELKEWNLQIIKETRRLNALLLWSSDTVTMGPDAARQLNRLFRRLARRFHPDLFPGDKERAQYYEIACNALSKGDLEMLQALDVATADMTDIDYGRLTEEELAGEIELLEEQLATCENRLRRLTATEPYTLRDKLDDPEWVSATVTDLRIRVEAFERERSHYTEAYEQLIKESERWAR